MGANGTCTGRAPDYKLRLGDRARLCGAHPKHTAHVRDSRRVKARRLIERLRVLRSRKEGIDITRSEVRAGTDGWAWGEDGGPGATARGAHKKHSTHGCDAGGVEAQRLIERLRVLPSRKERAYIRRAAEVRAARHRRVGMGRRRPKRHMPGRAPTIKDGGPCTTAGSAPETCFSWL